MLSWIHLLLYFVAYTVIPVMSSNKNDDEGLNRFEYYEKNNELSPLEILLEDDQFLRKSAEKHGYINGEWAGLLRNSTIITPCSENPRLNNPDCIKHGKISYSSSLEKSKNFKKYEDKHNYGRIWHYPRVSPSLAQTERYILGKRTKDTEFSQNTANAVRNSNKLNHLTITQNKQLHKIRPDGQRMQEEPIHSVAINDSSTQPERNLTVLEYSQSSNTTFKPTSVYEDKAQNFQHLNSAHSSNGSLGDIIPKENQTSPALLQPLNKTSDQGNPHATAELNKNASFTEENNTNSSNYTGQTLTEPTNSTSDNVTSVDNNSSDSVRTIEENEIGPYGRIDNSTINEANGSTRNKHPKSKSELIESHDAGNTVTESSQNETRDFNENTPGTYSQSEVGAYGLVEPTSLNTQNTTGKHDVFVSTNNESFSNTSQLLQETDSSEIVRETHTQNATGPYGFTNLTSADVNNTVPLTIPSITEMPSDNASQTASKNSLVLQKQNEIGPYGLVDTSTVNFNYHDQENNFSPSTTKPHSDTKLSDQEPVSKTNNEIGPYGLTDSVSVSNNLKPKDSNNISSDVEASLIRPPDQKGNDNANINPQNDSISQQVTPSNETSNQTIDTLRSGERIGPYGVDVDTNKSELISNNSENNEKYSTNALPQEEVNHTSGVAEPTFRILPHARVGNYSNMQPQNFNGTLEEKPKLMSVFPLNDTSVGWKSNRSLMIECPVQLCYCDNGKPVTGFRLIPF